MESHKLKSRFFSLVIPFVFWNIIGFLYFQILSLIPIARQYYGGNIDSLSLVNLLKAIISTDYNIATWFLKTLIVYSFSFPFIYPLVKNKKMSYLLLAFFLVINIIFYDNGEISRYIFYYYVGMLFAVNYKDLVEKKYNKVVICFSIVLYSLTIVFSTFFNHKYLNITIPLIRFIQILSFWVMTDLLTFDSKIVNFSKYTFVLYVTHSMILEPIEKLLYIFCGDNSFWALIDYIFAPIATIVFVIIIAKIFEKYKIYKFVNGGR